MIESQKRKMIRQKTVNNITNHDKLKGHDSSVLSDQ